ncbi:MAG: carbamoyltransferase HypF [Chromatiaceae bacterium]|nr:carbamoyltransferase HypF [Chromatiaceae bacterium]
MTSELIRVRGLVQGVGFRPTVWRLARECELRGDVRNDGEGVLARVIGNRASIDRFCRRLREECPPLARIDSLERAELSEPLDAECFRILASDQGDVHTGIVADAATCDACVAEIFEPKNRRYRYPFTNCTHCGPRLSIVRAIPYDRANTSMSAFPMCAECRSEYENPADRRFHAQPNACPRCGPEVWLEDAAGCRVPFDDPDAIAAASRLLSLGHILAIKGIGGFHLACDTHNEQAVSRLRARKRRFRKPFALMARDLEVIRRYCSVDETEAKLLSSPAAPVVLLETKGPRQLTADVAPGQHTLGFMLPYSPLHHLLLTDWDRPLVMTSGNLSEEPQCIDNEDAARRLGALADYYLLHDRTIVNRVDDSVVHVMDHRSRFLRRARGYAPTPIPLPPGFERAPPVLALGGELKNTISLLEDGQAILSQHLGNLEDARAAKEYDHAISLYRALFQHDPHLLATDLHPDYRSTHLGREIAAREGLELVPIQHHFAHIAGVLADNGRALDAGPVIGIALDGLGYGEDGTIWGGELLLADYRGYQRLAHLKPAPMPGGTKAILEPWRNTYAQLVTHIGWDTLRTGFPSLDITRFLKNQPLHVLDTMIERGLNTPSTSSCGRLFDAVAAALDVSREAVSYEGQAAIELETLAVSSGARDESSYPFAVETGPKALLINPKPMWLALLADLARNLAKSRIAARFHAGLAVIVSDLAIRLAEKHDADAIALSGGVFQNKTLFEAVSKRLATSGLKILSHRQVPTNDGGLALGQAVVAAAKRIP